MQNNDRFLDTRATRVVEIPQCRVTSLRRHQTMATINRVIKSTSTYTMKCIA